jgi:hypothetical protein
MTYLTLRLISTFIFIILVVALGSLVFVDRIDAADSFSLENISRILEPTILQLALSNESNISSHVMTLNGSANGIREMMNISSGEFIIFVINPLIQNTTAAENLTDISRRALSNLSIFTDIVNNCQPRSRCDNINPEDFQIQIFEFQDTKVDPITPVRSFSASSEGWTVTSLPLSTQYDVRLTSLNSISNTNMNMSYSAGCHGFMNTTQIDCKISTELTTMISDNGSVG